MRRIDLICKLIGPLFIALIDGISTQVAILVNGGMNSLTHSLAEKENLFDILLEVYHQVPGLQEPKPNRSKSKPSEGAEPSSSPTQIYRLCRRGIQKGLANFAFYFQHQMFLPSFAGTLLYFTVLPFAGQTVIWLRSAGYDSSKIAIARTLSVVFEVLATWIAPWMMRRIGPTRAGLWLAGWQIACLATGMAIFWRFTNDQSILSASGLVGGTILSRDVEVGARGSFSSTEAAWQNLFETLSYASTMIFSRPDQFRWPALISVIAVSLAGLLYAIFVRIQLCR
ncbi:Ferroporti-1 [Aspergillus keveii]|uniref:Solute carrier family 40 member n=1 Tax=Aspergillus keveii TaxID=714993 RepID=A0ABR4FH45_9EURO